MSLQFLSHIEGMEEELSALHMAAFPMGQGWKPKEFKELLEIFFHHILIYCDFQNKIRGFLLYSVIVDEAEIITFSVDPAYQRNGMGREIMAAFIKHMKKQHIRVIFLEVAESNLSAIRLYSRFDFFLNGRRLKYYDNKVDALLMKKTLLNE